MKKKLLCYLLTVMLLMTAYPAMAVFASEAFVTFSSTGKDNAVNVSLTLSSQESVDQVTTYQVGFDVSGTLVDAVDFDFSQQVKADKNITIKEAIYDGSTEVLTIYVSGPTTILKKGTKVNLGTITVEGSGNVTISMEEDSAVVVDKFHQKTVLSQLGNLAPYTLKLGDSSVPESKPETPNTPNTGSSSGSGSSLSDPREVKGDWSKKADAWVFKKQDGSFARNEWALINGLWYRFGDDTVMKTGWILDNGQWYFCEPSGAMKTGWVCVNNQWYFCNDSGAMKTGWILDHTNWYFTEPSGAMKTGWIEVEGKSYYMDESGKMLANTVTPDGNKVDKNGVKVSQ